MTTLWFTRNAYLPYIGHIDICPIFGTTKNLEILRFEVVRMVEFPDIVAQTSMDTELSY